jgi:hypothetical protein
MDECHVVYLGLALVLGSALVFVSSWVLAGCLNQKFARIGVERLWFKCVAACFGAGLFVLVAGATGSIIRNVLEGIR